MSGLCGIKEQNSLGIILGARIMEMVELFRCGTTKCWTCQEDVVLFRTQMRVIVQLGGRGWQG